MLNNPYAAPSRVGVRPDARLAQAFLTQAFFWMFLGLLLTTGIGAVVAGLSDTQLISLEGLVFPLIIGQLVNRVHPDAGDPPDPGDHRACCSSSPTPR